MEQCRHPTAQLTTRTLIWLKFPGERQIERDWSATAEAEAELDTLFRK
jgi:hypothetical protein